MEQEHSLQTSIARLLGNDNGPHATAISRILIQQQSWIRSNIQLLARRFERLPHPSRFRGYNAWPHAPSSLADPSLASGTLGSLIAQHERLLYSIEKLIEPGPAAGMGNQLLREVAHNHREMAWMLTALLNEDKTLRNRGASPGSVASSEKAGEAWENEGGAVTD